MEIIIGNRYTVSLDAALAAGYTAIDDEIKCDGRVVTTRDFGEGGMTIALVDGIKRCFWNAALIPLEAPAPAPAGPRMPERRLTDEERRMMLDLYRSNNAARCISGEVPFGVAVDLALDLADDLATAEIANAGHLALIAHIYSVANECAGSDTAAHRLFRSIKTAIESAGYVEADHA